MDNKLTQKSWVTDLICMLPAFVFLLSILLVRLHLFSMPLSDIYWTSALDTSTISDMFSFWKAIAILCAACLAGIFAIVFYLKDSIRFKKSFLYFPALVYTALVLISLVFSNFKYFAIRGMQEHFEGTFVLMAYIVVLFFLFNAIDSENRVKIVIFCVFGIAALLCILGITQAIGYDFFATAGGQKLVTPNYMLETGIKSWDMIDVLAANGETLYDFSFTDGEVYQTVYNINYVPFYLSLIIPVSATVFTYYLTREDQRKKYVSIIFLVLFGLLLSNFFGANSASGYFGLVTIIIASLIIFRRKIKQWLRPILCLIVVSGLVMGLFVNRWLPEVKELFNAAKETILIEKVYATNIEDIQYEYDNISGRSWIPVDYIITGKNSLVFGINGDEIVVTRDESSKSFAISDGKGEDLYLHEMGDSGEYEILDERFHDYARIALAKDGDGYINVIVLTHNYRWTFRYDNQFSYVNTMQKAVILDIVPHSSFIKNHAFGSWRGLIWDTTFPMLSKYVLRGSGADTFTFVYPQNDYATLYSERSVSLVTDKAHNLYLQYWINTGLVSLLAWLTLVGFYLAGAIKSFKKYGFVTFVDFINGGIFCGILGFLTIALFNDGSVNTMPMFYTMLGTGLAINAKEKWIKVEDEHIAASVQMPEI